MSIQNHKSYALPADTKSAAALDLVLQRLRRHDHLSSDEAFALLESLLDPDTSDAQIAAVLTALAQKGETSDELVGMAEAMRARMVPLLCEHPKVVDTAG